MLQIIIPILDHMKNDTEYTNSQMSGTQSFCELISTIVNIEKTTKQPISVAIIQLCLGEVKEKQKCIGKSFSIDQNTKI